MKEQGNTVRARAVEYQGWGEGGSTQSTTDCERLQASTNKFLKISKCLRCGGIVNVKQCRNKRKVWPGQSRACRREWGCRGCGRVVWRHLAMRPHPCRPRTQHRHHTLTHTRTHTKHFSYNSCLVTAPTIDICETNLPNANSYKTNCFVIFYCILQFTRFASMTSKHTLLR